MKCYQRLIRDQQAAIFQRPVLASLEGASVKPVSYEEARSIILHYEWLKNMGTTQEAYGLFQKGELLGVVCFGRTAGTNVFTGVCGEQYADQVIVLCRGACVHWAHPHSGSFLISRACKLVSTMWNYNIIIAYSDPEAGEIGTIYQACGWLYCGMTSATEKFDNGDGKLRDARLVSAYTRDRTGGTMKYKRSRAEQKAFMLANGVKFQKGTKKHRYVKFIGNRGEKREMLGALRWPVLPYPKRAGEVSTETCPDSIGEIRVQSSSPAPIHTQMILPNEP